MNEMLENEVMALIEVVLGPVNICRSAREDF